MRALAVAAAVAIGSTAVPASVPASPVRPALRRQVAAPEGEHPLERARRVAHQVPFSGTVVVTWTDGVREHRDELQVQAGGGAIIVDGRADPVIEMQQRRLARGHDDDWDLLWAPALGRPATVPEVDSKYVTVTLDEHPVVAGRPTDVVEIRDDGRSRARLYLDQKTGLLLRRDQFDDSGVRERSVEFRALTVDQGTPPLSVPPKASALLSGDDPSIRRVRTGRAPDVVGDGYTRLGVYRRGPVVQVHYSDGLYELSVFEQSGRLDDDPLPGTGRRVRVGGQEARLYAWPGGHVLVWQAGPVVRTVVSDAPSGQILGAAQSLPGPGWGRPSLLDKIRRAGAALVDPLS
ncbi:MAG: hypothetical protein M3179_03590 [Actinomycetota bacterium]|nr:hypothetical protein [Actinomycetota bacterium]